MNGSNQVPRLLPIVKKTLHEHYCDPEGDESDTSREIATARIVSEIQDQIIVPQTLQANINPGHDPVEVVSRISEIHIRKLINAAFDIDDPEASELELSTRFSNRVSNIVKRMVGELIDALKPCFSQGAIDVLTFFRLNIKAMIEKESETVPGIGMVSPVMVDTLMQ